MRPLGKERFLCLLEVIFERRYKWGWAAQLLQGSVYTLSSVVNYGSASHSAGK